MFIGIGTGFILHHNDALKYSKSTRRSGLLQMSDVTSVNDNKTESTSHIEVVLELNYLQQFHPHHLTAGNIVRRALKGFISRCSLDLGI